MLYYVQLSEKTITHAVTYPIEGYVQVDTKDMPLPAVLDENYKWNGNKYVYSTSSNAISYVKSFVEDGRLTVDELYQISKALYNDFGVLAAIIDLKTQADGVDG